MKYKIVRITIIAIICICFIHYLFSHYGGKEYTIDNVEDYVRRVCEIGNVPGMSIVVLDNGQEYYINIGYADKNEKVDMTSEIRCELGSTTKAFTALGVLLLEQDGKLDRADSVKNYISWFHPTYGGKEVNITIEHLLCHTSGIPVWTIANLPTGTINDVKLLENTVKKIESVKLDSAPGTVHNYATINYDVLALANISGSAPTKAADGIYRMLQGETVEMGFWMDGNSLIDLLCIISCLIESYIVVILFEKRAKKKYVCAKVLFCLLGAVIVLLFPCILHYNYFTLAVWFSPCLLIAIAGVEICFIEYIVLYICNRKKILSKRQKE